MVLLLFTLLLIVPGLDCSEPGIGKYALPAIEAELAELGDRSASDEQLTSLNQEFGNLFDRHHGCLQELVHNDSLLDEQLVRLYYLGDEFLAKTGLEESSALLHSVVKRIDEQMQQSSDYAKYYHRTLVGLRWFDEAERVRADWPDAEFPDIPMILRQKPAIPGARALYSPAPDGSSLREEHVDMTGYTGVIMVGHPRCPFSARAMTAIEEAPELAASLAEHGLFITDIWARLDDEVIVAWNNDNPRFAYRHLADGSAWPEVSYWGTPSFYFIREGEVVRKMVGWPRDEDDARRAALREGLAAAGLD